MAEPKRINIKQFREFGFLHEMNRLFLHPLGMALEIIQEMDETEKLGGIWDYRDDPEGIIFEEIDDDGREKIERVREFMQKKHEERRTALGYVIQPASEPVEKIDTKIFDPRDGQMKETDNPALILRDILTHSGAIILPLAIEAKFIELSNYCEESHKKKINMKHVGECAIKAEEREL